MNGQYYLHCKVSTLKSLNDEAHSNVIVGGANFRGKSQKALRINFCGFKFHDSKPVQGCGTAQNNDVMRQYTFLMSLVVFLVMKLLLQRLARDRRILVLRTPLTG